MAQRFVLLIVVEQVCVETCDLERGSSKNVNKKYQFLNFRDSDRKTQLHKLEYPPLSAQSCTNSKINLRNIIYLQCVPSEA